MFMERKKTFMREKSLMEVGWVKKCVEQSRKQCFLLSFLTLYACLPERATDGRTHVCACMHVQLHN